MNCLSRTAGLVLAFLALGLVAPTGVAEAKARITGKVMGADGKPIKGAEIEIYSKTYDRSWTTKTKKDGTFAIIVDGQEWKFTASAKGYQSVEEERQLAELGRKPTIDFTLAPEAAAAAAPVAAAPQAQDTPVPQVDLADLKAGNALMDQGKHREALASYQAALAKNPTLHLIHIAIGDAYTQLQEWDNAAKEYAQIPEGDKMYERALVGIANAQVRQDKFDEALVTYKKILGVNPANADANYMAGQLLFNKGEAQEAVQYLQAAETAKPDWEKVQIQLAYTYMNLGENAKAKAAFQKYLQLNPSAPDAADVQAMIDMIK